MRDDLTLNADPQTPLPQLDMAAGGQGMSPPGKGGIPPGDPLPPRVSGKFPETISKAVLPAKATRYAPRMAGFVSYLRVSTDRQGKSGLGIEAQRKAVADRLADEDDLIAEYIEIESGKRSDRPELVKALRECRVRKATLIVAKVDRLTRNLHFLTGLIEAGVEPIFCDLPDTTGPVGRFLLTQMAAVAELERAMISKRTKDALAAVKARGVKLGGYKGGTADYSAQGKLSGQVRAKAAQDRADDLREAIERARADGATSLSAIAAHLNAQGIPTPSGGQWFAQQVKRVLARLDPPTSSS